MSEDKTNVVRMDSNAYSLIKEYAAEQGIAISCAIADVMSCPVKAKKLENGEPLSGIAPDDIENFEF